MESEVVVVDTDIIIDHTYQKSHLLSKLLTLQQKGTVCLIISSITIFEYFSSTSFIDIALYETANSLFSNFIVQEVTEDIARIAAQLNRELGLYRKIQATDILIGATCLFLGAKLLTRNKKHFRYIPSISFV